MAALVGCIAVAPVRAVDAVRLVDVFPGDEPDAEINQYPSEAAVIDGIVYFTLFDAPHGRELWRSDGTPEGTRMVRDLAPGPESSAPGALTAIGRTLYFGASDRQLGCRLWRSDGTAAGTRPLAAFQAGPFGCYDPFAFAYDGPSQFTAVGRHVFFAAGDAPHGEELWRTDGTANGTRLVRDIAPGSDDGAASSWPRGLTAVGGQLLFIATDEQHGRELWHSDGTSAGTVLVRDISPGPNGGLSASDELAVVDGVAVFVAGDDDHGFEPWRSDGSEAGTSPLADLSAGRSSSMLGADRRALPVLALDGEVYLWAFAGEPARPSVWRTDGRSAPRWVGDLPFGGFRVRPVAVGRRAYFAWFDPIGAGIWHADAEGTVLARAIPRAPLGSPIGGFLAVGDLLVFLAHDASHGCALWRSDGSAAGTRVVADVTAAAFDCSAYSGLWTAAAAEHVLFEGNDGVTGFEPWALPIAALAVDPVCAGDCDGNARVGIDELVRGVGIALGSTPAATCPAFDGDGDAMVSIAELITAVTAALNGC